MDYLKIATTPDDEPIMELFPADGNRARNYDERSGVRTWGGTIKPYSKLTRLSQNKPVKLPWN